MDEFTLTTETIDYCYLLEQADPIRGFVRALDLYLGKCSPISPGVLTAGNRAATMFMDPGFDKARVFAELYGAPRDNEIKKTQGNELITTALGILDRMRLVAPETYASLVQAAFQGCVEYTGAPHARPLLHQAGLAPDEKRADALWFVDTQAVRLDLSSAVQLLEWGWVPPPAKAKAYADKLRKVGEFNSQAIPPLVPHVVSALDSIALRAALAEVKSDSAVASPITGL